jgi:UDP-2,3-diacylglucosamine hydrolase
MTRVPASGDRVGILAGRGVYPQALCERLAKDGVAPLIACLAGQTDPKSFPSAARAAVLPIGALRETARFFVESGASLAYFAGGVAREGAFRFARPDFSALSLLPRALLGGDDDLLGEVANRFERFGVAVGDPRPLLGDLLATEGLIAGPRPSASVRRDLEVAVRAAAANHLGQAAIAFRGRAVLSEDRRGTDALLSSAPGPLAVLAKIARENQDPRFDLPSIGPSTIIIARAVGLAAIAVETEMSLVLSKPHVIELCDAAKISLVGVSSRATASCA